VHEKLTRRLALHWGIELRETLLPRPFSLRWFMHNRLIRRTGNWQGQLILRVYCGEIYGWEEDVR
jgi:hypothetical protein